MAPPHDGPTPPGARGRRGSATARPSVVLVRPPLRVARASYSTLACPPLGLAYLAASLREAGLGARILDAVGEAPRRYFRLPDTRFLGLGLDAIPNLFLDRWGVDVGGHVVAGFDWHLAREVMVGIDLRAYVLLTALSTDPILVTATGRVSFAFDY